MSLEVSTLIQDDQTKRVCFIIFGGTLDRKMCLKSCYIFSFIWNLIGKFLAAILFIVNVFSHTFIEATSRFGCWMSSDTGAL